MRTLSAILLTVVLILATAACGSPQEQPAAQNADESKAELDYAATIEAWQQERLENLTRDRGWLTLVGLYWLKPGENRIGTAEEDAVRFDPAFAPGELGSFMVEDRDGVLTATLKPLPGSGLLLNGEPATSKVLAADTDENTDYLEAGDLQFYLIRREDRLGVRAKHPQAKTNLEFHGLDFYPIDESWRIEAEYVPYDEPRTVSIASVIGTTSESLVPGEVTFERDGARYTLLPLNDGPEDPTFFYIFKDATSGKETYPAGRFLEGPAPDGETVILDFNTAYSPPCAFTPYATCPLPPKENQLDLAITAGEKFHGDH